MICDHDLYTENPDEIENWEIGIYKITYCMRCKCWVGDLRKGKRESIVSKYRGGHNDKYREY